MPVFSKKHCDLKPSSPPNNSPQCGCSNTFQTLPNGSNHILAPVPTASMLPVNPHAFPFSNQFSANVCFQCAFNIADSYQKLPYPQPVRSNQNIPVLVPWMQNKKVPRMIPIFSCCAMQSSYAMIMLSYKAQSLGFLTTSDDGRSMNQGNMLAQLQKGLGAILDALSNYSLAYEGLSGMRGKSKSTSYFPCCGHLLISLLLSQIKSNSQYSRYTPIPSFHIATKEKPDINK